MKNKMVLIGLFGFFMLISCEKEPPKLPEETQEGLMTFGCLVNGELVIQRNNNKRWDRIDGIYDDIKNQFVLITVTEYVENEISIFVSQPQVGICVIDSAIFYPRNSSHYFVARNTGQMKFTRFDSGYASGTFEFDANGYEKQTHQLIPNQKIQVSKGVFDIKYY